MKMKISKFLTLLLSIKGKDLTLKHYSIGDKVKETGIEKVNM